MPPAVSSLFLDFSFSAKFVLFFTSESCSITKLRVFSIALSTPNPALLIEDQVK